jgi:DNA-binding IclR family transcriptional regulator
MGNDELARRTGMPKPTISRLTHTLTKLGFLNFSPKFFAYELGPQTLALGYVAISNLDVRRIAHPMMEQLADETGFNVGLGMLDRKTMIYADACEGKGLIGLTLRPGSHIPVLTTAMGRAYLAGIPEQERRELVLALSDKSAKENTAALNKVERAVRQVNEMGFCVSFGEWQSDIFGVAAPIRIPAAGKCYAINLGGPNYLVSESKATKELGPRVANLAGLIERNFSARN